ncbi:DUF3263 domain-containing protein [Microbacterium sp. HSID17254]|uniref:DUF3263 domain-containing protein n=1 Tax=Microbacterium sp. HSID17254 TaxID=2419509 RepID=UPI000F892D45|nr:DUF3263 domain-containing protein [Microbacterium sp. HSID17254]
MIARTRSRRFVSVDRGIVSSVTPAELLAFEARHPKHTSAKTHAILHQLGITEVRYYTLLHRAAQSAEGIKTDPVTARMVRERAERQAAARAGRTAA